MLKRMPDEDIHAIQTRILEMCNSPDGANSKEIWEDEELAPMCAKYKRVTIMDIVHGLKRVGFLFDTGLTRGNLYFITPEGQEGLKRFKATGTNTSQPVYPQKAKKKKKL